MRRLILLALICASFAAPQTQSANYAPRLNLDPSKGLKPIESYEVPDFDKEALIPLKKAQEEKAAREAEVARIAAEKRLAEEAAPRASYYRPPVVTAIGNGSIMRGNNCVQCVYQMTGRRQNGNAGQWQASSSTPWVGAIMIWRPGEQGAHSAGHVGVVKGINSDGTVSIAHCAWSGGQTTFHSTGKFW